MRSIQSPIDGFASPFGPRRGSFTANVPVIHERATEAWSQSLDGTLYRFAPDVPRKTNRGWSIAGAATREHGEAPTNGSTFGATLTTLDAEGLFNPMRVASGGNANHRRATGASSVTNGVKVYCRVRVRAGTSGRVGIFVRNNTAETLTSITGTFAAPTVTGAVSGPITDLVNRLLPNGDREFTFTWTPNADGASADLGVGPESAVTGEYIDVIGMQAATAFTDHIMGGDGPKAVAADIMSLDLTGLDMSAGFMLRMDGEVDGTPLVASDRFYQAGAGVNRSITFVNTANGHWTCMQFDNDVLQGSIKLNDAVTPPSAFSIIGAHGTNYIGGASGGVVAIPDTVAAYVTPSVLNIGSSGEANFLPLTLDDIRLVTGAPTTPKVTELAG